MKTIKVKQGGCGVYCKDAHGVARYALKTAADKPFEVDDAQAERLVRLGVAAYVTETAVAEPVAQQEGDDKGAPSQESEKESLHLDAEELEKWDYNDLKKLAADMGVKPEGQKKADYIAAIVAADVEVDELEGDDEDDQLPELNAADPE